MQEAERQGIAGEVVDAVANKTRRKNKKKDRKRKKPTCGVTDSHLPYYFTGYILPKHP
jgi:hypothetical protein